MNRISLLNAERLSEKVYPRPVRLRIIGFGYVIAMGLGVFLSPASYDPWLMGILLTVLLSARSHRERIYGTQGEIRLMKLIPVKKTRVVMHYGGTLLRRLPAQVGSFVLMELIAGALAHGVSHFWLDFSQYMFNFEQAKGFAYFYLMWTSVLFLTAAFSYQRKAALQLAGCAVIAAFLALCNYNIRIHASGGFSAVREKGIVAVFNTLPNPEITLAVQAVVCGAVIAASVFSLFYSAYKKPKGAEK
ncbi:MAG: hypothetical protein QM689_09335 [Oscillospiraceae bacterium]